MFAINFDAGKSVSFNLTVEQVAQLLAHANVHQHLLTIGLKNVLQDCHASITREDYATEDEWIAAKRAKAELKLGSMLAGDMRAQSNARKAKMSDFDAFARKWILARAKAKFGKDEWKAKTEGDTGAAFIEAIVERNLPKFEAEIKAAYEAEMAAKAKEAQLADSMDLDI
jgi:hypothetical protein